MHFLGRRPGVEGDGGGPAWRRGGGVARPDALRPPREVMEQVPSTVGSGSASSDPGRHRSSLAAPPRSDTKVVLPAIADELRRVEVHGHAVPSGGARRTPPMAAARAQPHREDAHVLLSPSVIAHSQRPEEKEVEKEGEKIKERELRKM